MQHMKTVGEKLDTRYDRSFNIFRKISSFMISRCETETWQAYKYTLCEEKEAKLSLLAQLASNTSKWMTCPI
jgi:hypothetical protein